MFTFTEKGVKYMEEDEKVAEEVFDEQPVWAAV